MVSVESLLGLKDVAVIKPDSPINQAVFTYAISLTLSPGTFLNLYFERLKRPM